jgi:hypothetical protein
MTQSFGSLNKDDVKLISPPRQVRSLAIIHGAFILLPEDDDYKRRQRLKTIKCLTHPSSPHNPSPINFELFDPVINS